MTLPQGFLPLLPLKNTIVFPGISQVIKVGRERSINALKFAEKNGFWIVAVQQKHKEGDDVFQKDQTVEPHELFSVGTLCRIESSKGTPEGGYQVVLRGFARVDLHQTRVVEQKNYLESSATTLEDILDINPATSQVLLESLKKLSQDILGLIPGNTNQLSELVTSVDDLGYLSSLCAANIDIDLDEKQSLLEMTNLKERTLKLLTLMQEFKEGLSVQAEIRGKLSQKLGQTQRNIILREQLKAIREELGEGDDVTQEDKLREKIDKAGMPEEVRKVAESELKRLKEVGPQAPEAHIIRNYLDLLVALPWTTASKEADINLESAKAILDGDHYGLDKVKKRIIQHLAVLKLRKENKGSILLFVGPPGVGKTSLGQSIAKALGKKFVRVSVGGVRDDAEVRGHRKTYIGAMPGRIIQGLKRAGENNPVFLLDEIDKLSRSFNGDPASALLEVLDPEQNKTFLDHYLDVPYDLSNVFFIATANSLESIPAPLLDRMEVIDLSGYTTAEKMHIAKNHLIPKQLKEHGLENGQVTISDDSLLHLISNYTREAGVRDLQRKIVSVLRGVSEKVISATSLPVKVETLNLEEILGPERFSHEITETLNPPGVTTGLAWTPVGGDILFIESSAMPGKGVLTITGQLGDVMKESAQIGLSLIRSHAHQLGVVRDLEKTDIHIHVPAGAIPKDGPSAGVTMLTSLASLLSGRTVNPKLAMTGEVTLRGSVLPVGGIKEKIIAAHRAGVLEVILPAKNKKDLREVPDDIKEQIKFHFAENIIDLFKIALDLEVNFTDDFAADLIQRPQPPAASGH